MRVGNLSLFIKSHHRVLLAEVYTYILLAFINKLLNRKSTREKPSQLIRDLLGEVQRPTIRC